MSCQGKQVLTDDGLMGGQ